MSDLRHDSRRFGLVMCGLLFVPTGAACAIISGLRVYALAQPWASNDPAWCGVFMGPLFVFVGGMFIWDWLFAKPLTPEQQRFRDMHEAWDEERRRIFGDGS